MSLVGRAVKRCLLPAGDHAAIVVALTYWDALDDGVKAAVMDALDAASRSDQGEVSRVARIALDVLFAHGHV